MENVRDLATAPEDSPIRAAFWVWLYTCRCGCLLAVHRHYRPGSDCALCDDCPRWRRRWRG